MSQPVMEPEFEMCRTPAGAASLRSLVHGETFHPGIGPMEEALTLHVRPQRLAERARAAGRPLVVWDVGLGAAANALAVLEEGQGQVPIELHSFEVQTSALRFALQHRAALGYLTAAAPLLEELLARGQAMAGQVAWSLHLGDFRMMMHQTGLPAPDAILYDPYSPRANPELWELPHFAKLRGLLKPARPCLLTSYSLSTAVRVTLLRAGFYVGTGTAIGEKHETTLATNDLALLPQPLGTAWLARVQRSTRGGPLRAGHAGGPISEEDWQALQAHPQFTLANP